MEAKKKISALAVTSLVLGMITLPSVFCCVGFGTGSLSVMFGIIALVHAHNGEVSESSKVIAWTGIVTSALAMVGYLIYFGIFLAANPPVH